VRDAAERVASEADDAVLADPHARVLLQQLRGVVSCRPNTIDVAFHASVVSEGCQGEARLVSANIPGALLHGLAAGLGGAELVLAGCGTVVEVLSAAPHADVGELIVAMPRSGWPPLSHSNPIHVERVRFKHFCFVDTTALLMLVLGAVQALAVLTTTN
jgi:hypothetical protein